MIRPIKHHTDFKQLLPIIVSIGVIRPIKHHIDFKQLLAIIVSIGVISTNLELLLAVVINVSSRLFRGHVHG
jgi:hypothetical protein